jgi:hypothetical protein
MGSLHEKMNSILVHHFNQTNFSSGTIQVALLRSGKQFLSRAIGLTHKKWLYQNSDVLHIGEGLNA